MEGEDSETNFEFNDEFNTKESEAEEGEATTGSDEEGYDE